MTSRARASFSTTARRSPASGVPVKPSTSTGIDGPALSHDRRRCRRRARARGPIRRRPRRCRRPCSVPRWTSTVATGPRPRSSLASITVPSAGRSGLALRSRISACSAMVSSSLSRLVLLGRRDFDVEHVAAERFDLDLVLQQLGAHALGLGVRLVDLVDRDDDRNLGGLGVIDRLDRLRHDAVVGRDHQDDEVGDLGAARAHRGEGGVAGRVDEGDLAARGRGHLIGADMLGDAAGFAAHHIGLADGVEQRGLAVVDMAHDGHDRRARTAASPDRRPRRTGLLDVGFGDALAPCGRVPRR